MPLPAAPLRAVGEGAELHLAALFPPVPRGVSFAAPLGDAWTVRGARPHLISITRRAGLLPLAPFGLFLMAHCDDGSFAPLSNKRAGVVPLEAFALIPDAVEAPAPDVRC